MINRSDKQLERAQLPKRRNTGRTLLQEIFTRHFVLANESTVFLLVSALDFFVTYLILAWPGSPGYELNPIARTVFSWGLRAVIGFKFGMAALAIVCCEVVARRNPGLGRAVLVGLTLVVTAVVVYGLRLLVRNVI